MHWSAPSFKNMMVSDDRTLHVVSGVQPPVFVTITF